VRVHWKDYGHYPEYPQLHGPYASNLSIVDLLMNCGDDAPHYIWGYRTPANDGVAADEAIPLEADRDR
jgi:hypothetical protein